MNYGELKTEIGNISHRTDYSSFFDNWIELVEGTIARNLRAFEMIDTVTLDETDRVSSGNIYLLPTDFLEQRQIARGTIAAGNTQTLKPVSLEAQYSYARNNTVWGYTISAIAGAPVVLFIGTPATDSEFTVWYFQRQVLDVAQDSNTTKVLTQHAEVYLHGMLFYVYQRSQDLELAQAHADQMTEAMTTLNEQCGRFLGGAVGKATYNLGNINRQRGF